jgi:hypothetical protein
MKKEPLKSLHSYITTYDILKLRQSSIKDYLYGPQKLDSHKGIVNGIFFPFNSLGWGLKVIIKLKE